MVVCAPGSSRCRRRQARPPSGTAAHAVLPAVARAGTGSAAHGPQQSALRLLTIAGGGGDGDGGGGDGDGGGGDGGGGVTYGGGGGGGGVGGGDGCGGDGGGGGGDAYVRAVQQWKPAQPFAPLPHSMGELAKPTLQQAPSVPQ